MILQPPESERFFHVWWPLLHFTNRELRLFPKLVAAPSDRPPPTMEAAYQIRIALWKDPAILKKFVKENPHGLAADDLSLAASWTHRMEGTFFAFRHLKRHSILIKDGGPPRALAVHGITSSFAELLGPDVPVATQAVLLPFDEKIVCDGLLAPYPVVFGSGIRRGLKETYDRIRERDAVIESLPPKDHPAKLDAVAIQRRNAKLLDEFRRNSYVAGRSSATVDRDVAVLQSLAEHMKLDSDPQHGLIDVSAADIRAHVSSGASRLPGRTQAISRFVRFLAETGRVEPGTARALSAAAAKEVRLVGTFPGS